MNLLQFLDEDSLNNVSEAFPSARDLIKNNFGIKITIPVRNWVFLGVLSRITPYNTPKQISNNSIAKTVRQVEGKKIRDLNMNEMPGAYKKFDFDKFLAYPRYLKRVKLKYCDISLVHELLIKCTNLEFFHYETGILRELPYEPICMLLTQAVLTRASVPAHDNDFFEKIDGFQNNVFQLNNLKEISITMVYMLQRLYTDWHNVIYVFLRLPALPSVTKFNFKFSPKSNHLTWKTHLLILACLADFLLKLPNLTHFQYHSTYNVDPAHDRLSLESWKMDMLCGLIVRYGSNHLKNMGTVASNQRTPGVVFTFQDSLKETLNEAARSLQHLESLDMTLGETKEQRVLKDFILHLPATARVTSVSITDLSQERDLRREDIYKVFALPHENLQRLPMFDSITILSVHCTRALLQRASLTRILEGLPQLNELQYKGPSDAAVSYLDLEDRPANPEIFRRLEKLSVENVCLTCEELPLAENSSRAPVLCRFKNLKELNLQSTYFGHGIQVVGIMETLVNLRKLRRVLIKPMLFYPFAGERHPNGRGLDILGKIGFVRQCEPDIVSDHVIRVYEFMVN